MKSREFAQQTKVKIAFLFDSGPQKVIIVMVKFYRSRRYALQHGIGSMDWTKGIPDLRKLEKTQSMSQLGEYSLKIVQSAVKERG